MAPQIANPRWGVFLIVGTVVCIVVLTVALSGYSLKVHSRLVTLEMHPVVAPPASTSPR
jgi:hypothetical protein